MRSYGNHAAGWQEPLGDGVSTKTYALRPAGFRAVDGSITLVISTMRVAGKPEISACCRMTAFFGEVYADTDR